jgi:regulatory protein
MDEERDFQRAKELAINLISYRPRSSKEVRSHLVSKGYPFPLADQVVNYLKASCYIDDQEFAEKWYISRLKKGSYGPQVIYKELVAKGISPEICQELREKFYPEEKEREEVMRFIEKKSMNKLHDSQYRRKIYRMLYRRGFSSGIIMEILGMPGMDVRD